MIYCRDIVGGVSGRPRRGPNGAGNLVALFRPSGAGDVGVNRYYPTASANWYSSLAAPHRICLAVCQQKSSPTKENDGRSRFPPPGLSKNRPLAFPCETSTGRRSLIHFEDQPEQQSVIGCLLRSGHHCLVTSAGLTSIASARMAFACPPRFRQRNR